MKHFSVADTARIFGVRESRLRYWQQSGFLWPSVRKKNRFFYTFQDLIAVQAATELLEAGIPITRVRKALATLRSTLPGSIEPTSRLRVCSDGHTMVVVDDDVVYEPESGQTVMTFAVDMVRTRIARQLPTPIPAPIAKPKPTKPARAPAGPSAFRLFGEALEAQDRGDVTKAEKLYRAALKREPSFAAARTNLGNLLHQRGDLNGAVFEYESALQSDPDLPDARTNLASLHDDLGATELAISELRQVCTRHPHFADAHYTLGVILARVGGVAQAREHLARYLELDPKSPFANRAQAFLDD